jgi:hypothetical protein
MRGASTAPVTPTVQSSTFSDNSAVGAIHGGWGDALYAETTYPASQDAMKLTITDSTCTHNQGRGVGEGRCRAISATVSVIGGVFSEQ